MNYYMAYKHTGFAKFFKVRRYRAVREALGITSGSVLDVGCGDACDFLQFAEADGFTCHGLDIVSVPLLCNAGFTMGDARRIPFPDKSFDAAVSIGLFEHLAPMADLEAATREIARVASRFCVVVPAVSTIFEPHTKALFWPLRSPKSKRACHVPLHYFSDETWLEFSGFRSARTSRYSYMPGMTNLLIYGP